MDMKIINMQEEQQQQSKAESEEEVQREEEIESEETLKCLKGPEVFAMKSLQE
jgi:hypothetical protein